MADTDKEAEDGDTPVNAEEGAAASVGGDATADAATGDAAPAEWKKGERVKYKQGKHNFLWGKIDVVNKGYVWCYNDDN